MGTPKGLRRKALHEIHFTSPEKIAPQPLLRGCIDSVLLSGDIGQSFAENGLKKCLYVVD